MRQGSDPKTTTMHNPVSGGLFHRQAGITAATHNVQHPPVARTGGMAGRMRLDRTRWELETNSILFVQTSDVQPAPAQSLQRRAGSAECRADVADGLRRSLGKTGRDDQGIRPVLRAVNADDTEGKEMDRSFSARGATGRRFATEMDVDDFVRGAGSQVARLRRMARSGILWLVREGP